MLILMKWQLPCKMVKPYFVVALGLVRIDISLAPRVNLLPTIY
jgi:hypothetical protein